MQSSEQPFKEYWTKTIWPALQTDYERLVKTTPKRIAERVEKDRAEKNKKDKEPEGKTGRRKEKDPVQEKLARAIEEAKEKGERRNAYMNLAWTGPTDNTMLQETISLGKVENVAADMFLKNLPTTGADETAAEPGEAAEGIECSPQSKPQRRAVETLSASAKKPWNIPKQVEKGFEIPIMVSSVNQFVAPDLGKFKRLAMDVVVNAAWLALYWAKSEGSREAVTALEELILDWPFDFIHIKGATAEEIEENKFKWAVNASARTERLRDFVGLENSNLLRIVAKAADIVRARATGGGQPAPEKVHEWLVNNVTWGVHHCPDVQTVKRHMQNWAALAKCPAVITLMESAVTRWGRDNLLDWPTKLGAIVTKTDHVSLGYVVEALFTRMWRTNKKDPYASGSALNDVINEILWVRTYVSAFVRQYPELFKSGASCNGQGSQTTQGCLSEAKVVGTARSYLDSPLQFFLQSEGPDKDPTWIQSLPSEALRLTMKHFLDLGQGFYKSEIAGALSQPKSERYSLEKFHKGQRVLKRFFEPFQIAYDSLAGVSKPAPEEKQAEAEAAADGAKGIGKEVASEENKKVEVSPGDVTSFRKKCEEACAAELDGRVVMLVAEGTDVEIFQSVTQTRFYKNLTDAATVMGFYDVKNARLCNVFEGQVLTHKEPALEEADFERYLKSLSPLMAPGRDVLWVLTGRTQSNVPKIKKILAKSGFNFLQFHLCYNTKQMQQYGHFKRQRGFANSRSHEVMLFAYKGRIPKHLPKVREHVDAGSLVWNEVVKNVPVLPQKSHALVSKQVRETSLQAMVGTCITEVEAQEREKDGLQELPPNDDEDAPDAATADAGTAVAPEKQLVNAAVKKRKLYRQLTGTEVPWFPHDNAIEFLMELCHEAGRPRWVYFGTPAGGAGMHGCMEKGASVLALCFDDHHRTNLRPFLTERAVEAMLSNNTMVFMNDALLQRSVQLRLTKDDAPKEEQKDEKKADKKEKNEKPEDQKKGKKTTDKKKKKKKPKKKADDASSSSTDSDPTSDDDSPKKKKPKTSKD